MNNLKKLFTKNNCNIIGMIHVKALPGTPGYKSGSFDRIVSDAVKEANIYKKNNCDGIILENMHDIPYIQSKYLGPETVASMTVIAQEVKRSLASSSIKIGLQILACGNCEAIAVAKATGAQFIRNEGFVFSHIADEGFTDANAGTLLRYRKHIDADDILVFTDIKKKHSSHSITADTSLLDTAKAAEFFLSDGIILTGSGTGVATDTDDLDKIYGKINLPILIGSGVTLENLHDYFNKANGLIIGSYFKEKGIWKNNIDEERIEKFMALVEELRNKDRT